MQADAKPTCSLMEPYEKGRGGWLASLFSSLNCFSFYNAPVQDKQAMLEERIEMFEATISKKRADLNKLLSVGKQNVKDMDPVVRQMYLTKIKTLKTMIAKQENIKTTIESALDTMKDLAMIQPVIEIIKITKEQSKSHLSQIDIDQVDSCMAELDDIINDARAATDVLAQPLSSGTGEVFEEDIDAELDSIFGFEEGEKIKQTPLKTEIPVSEPPISSRMGETSSSSSQTRKSRISMYAN